MALGVVALAQGEQQLHLQIGGDLWSRALCAAKETVCSALGVDSAALGVDLAAQGVAALRLQEQTIQ